MTHKPSLAMDVKKAVKEITEADSWSKMLMYVIWSQNLAIKWTDYTSEEWEDILSQIVSSGDYKKVSSIRSTLQSIMTLNIG